MTGATTSTWARAIGIRPGEGRAIALVAALFAALEAGRGFGEIGVDTLVLSRFGAQTLPYLFIGLGLTSLVAALAYGAALGRLPRIPLLAGLMIGAAALLAVERVLMASGHPATIPIAWLTVYAVGAIAVTISWTMAGSVFDARQAKRLFPLCTAAAIAGGFVGTLSSGPVARVAGTETLVLIEAVFLAVVGILIWAISRTTSVRVPARRDDRSILADLRVGYDEVRRTPLMALVAIAYVLLAILLFSVSYPFLLAASEAFPDEADLATALGLVSAAVTAISFLVSVLLANRVYARFGVAGAALALPLVYVAGFGLWIVAFSFATAALVRATQQITQRGLSNAAWSAFYNVIPTERRAQALAFNDGVPGQLGTILSGILLLAAGTLLTLDQLFWLGAATALVCAVVVVAIRRRYAESLMRTLRAGLGEQILGGGPGLAILSTDPTVTRTLVAALDTPEPGVRRMAVELLAHSNQAGPDAERALTAAAADDDPSVRVAALQGLASSGVTAHVRATAHAGLGDPEAVVRATAVGLLAAVSNDADREAMKDQVEPLATDASPEVRAAVASALSSGGSDPRSAPIVEALLTGSTVEERVAGLEAVRRLGEPLPIDTIRSALTDPSPAIRAAATGALAVDADDELVVPLTLAALDDEAAIVRGAASASLAARPGAAPALIDLLEHDSRRARKAALVALQRHAELVRDDLIAWTGGRLVRAASLRDARRSLAPATATDPPPPDSEVALLADTLGHRERDLVDLSLSALVVLGVPEADGLLRRCLRSDEGEVRAQALEALDSIGDRRLTHALVRLLEDEGQPSTDRAAILARLIDDGDPWISALAERVPAVATEWRQMPETSRLLDDIETMLFLRRVPLFEGLAPEDLQRIAATASEHLYPAGELIMREGDIADELVVLIEGSVRVVRIDAVGSERYIRGYEAGDHIGELAVLREAPRSATVIAEEPGVRGLVISGEGLKAILRERPEAAMAMLATLADRISRQ